VPPQSAVNLHPDPDPAPRRAIPATSANPFTYPIASACDRLIFLDGHGSMPDAFVRSFS